MTTKGRMETRCYIVELDCIPTHHNIGRMSNISRNCLRPEVNRQSKQPVLCLLHILFQYTQQRTVK